MTTEVIVAMIASGGGLLGSAIGVIASARLTNYRIGQMCIRDSTRTDNRIRIGDKQYGVDDERKLRTKHVLIVSEV